MPHSRAAPLLPRSATHTITIPYLISAALEAKTRLSRGVDVLEAPSEPLLPPLPHDDFHLPTCQQRMRMQQSDADATLAHLGSSGIGALLFFR